MKANLTLRRPNNWQDFETLCKKLWGEIWNCTEIKKNGRSGQLQDGVDVYGIPQGENQYYGIQCKGKDEYTNRQLTQSEIDSEIKMAENFKPALKKLYFATTAVKDVRIEQYVRIKNSEYVQKGLFEIHLFCWEDIVELIDENRQTHDWYIKNQHFKNKKSVAVTFSDGSEEMIIKPRFQRTIITHKQKIVPAIQYHSPYESTLDDIFYGRKQRTLNVLSYTFYSKTINHSYCPVKIQMHNTSIESIEDFKLLFRFSGNIIHLTDTNIHNKSRQDLAILINKRGDLNLSKDANSGEIVPLRSILVGDEVYESPDIYIKSEPREGIIELHWKLISKDYKDEGILRIIAEPDLSDVHKDMLHDDPFKVKGRDVGDYDDVIQECD